MSAKLSFRRELRHPPSRVWRALTNSAILADWLFPNNFRAVEGENFTFKGPAQPHWDGTITGTVLSAEEPTRLSLQWKANSIDGARPLETVVTFTLEPFGSGTILLLEQDGFLPDQIRNRSGAESGWPRLLNHLEVTLQRLEGDQACTQE